MNLINRIKYSICKMKSKTLIKYLKNKGCNIGDNVHFHDPKSLFIDLGMIKFIEIGNNVNITKDVKILAHDYSYKVFRPIYHDMPQKFGKTIIGNNVFIGMNSVILMGSVIGDNVVVGAGSVVTGNIPNNCVIAGNPAKVICSLDEYHKKTVDRFQKSAILFAKEFYKKNNRYPYIEEFGFYKVLFLEKTNENRHYFEEMTITGDNKTEVINDLMKIKNKYKNYNDFISKIKENR